MPDIIDPHQNVQHIRLQIQNIPLHPGVKIHDPVAADATVEKPVPPRRIQPQPGGDQSGIPLAQVTEVFPIPPGIGDGISHKKNRLHNCS